MSVRWAMKIFVPTRNKQSPTPYLQEIPPKIFIPWHSRVNFLLKYIYIYHFWSVIMDLGKGKNEKLLFVDSAWERGGERVVITDTINIFIPCDS